MEEKSYYLSSFRAIFIGIILIIMGIALTCIGLDIEQSFWYNFQLMILNFQGVGSFFASLILLFIKIGFIVVGYFILKYRGQMIRAKIDNKGLYFKEMTGANKYEKLAFDLNPLIFLPYSKIINIYYVEDFWLGDSLEIETSSERKKLITLNALSKSEKKEIFERVQQGIQKNSHSFG